MAKEQQVIIIINSAGYRYKNNSLRRSGTAEAKRRGAPPLSYDPNPNATLTLTLALNLALQSTFMQHKKQQIYSKFK